MAFKRNTITGAPANITFINDFVETLSTGLKKSFNHTIHQVTAIVKPKSGKGFVLNTTKGFACFVWRNSSEGKDIQAFIDGEQDFCPCIAVNLSLKSLFELGFDDELQASAIEKIENRWEIIHGTKLDNETAEKEAKKTPKPQTPKSN